MRNGEKMEIDDIYFTIGQVAEHVDLPQSVLRYWETVFDVLNPQKSKGGNRRYRKEDIEIILKIKELLYEQGFTIKGANKQLNSIYQMEHEQKTPNREETLSADLVPESSNERENAIRVNNDIPRDKIKRRLQEIIKILDTD